MLEDLLDVAVLGSIYTLFALGMSLAWSTIGILNFAHGAIFMFSSFVAYLVVQHARLPLVALLAIGVATGAVLSALLDVLAFQPILRRARNHRSAELQVLVGGIGVASIPVAIAERQTQSNPFGFTGTSFSVHVYTWGALRITNIQILILALTVVLCAGLLTWVRRSQTGLALRSIGVDAETAALMGINQRSLSTITMAAAGGLAGLAGVLLTFQLVALDPNSSDDLLVKAFSAIILGGLGSLGGTVFGCFILAACETVVTIETSGQWVDAISYGLIFIVLLLRPWGLFGTKEVRRT
jgi:branched-chain amino acid transport system permease protein